MPIPKRVSNAFTVSEVSAITGISRPMLDYLLRSGFLAPTYGHGARGKVRYYSYRDLVVARLVQRLREAGIQLSKLKAAIRRLSQDGFWAQEQGQSVTPLRFLISDGRQILIRGADGFLEEIGGQRSFAFVVNVETVKGEVRRRIEKAKRGGFSMENVEPIFESTRRRKRSGR